MKNIEREITLIGSLPNHIRMEDCEVIIHKATISYRDSDGSNPVTLEYNDETSMYEVDIELQGTSFTNPDGGEVLETD